MNFDNIKMNRKRRAAAVKIQKVFRGYRAR